MAAEQQNARFWEWRIKADLSRGEMAKMVNLTHSGIKYGLVCDEERIRRWETGEVSWPREPYRLALTELTRLAPEDLGFTPTRRGIKACPELPPISIDTLVNKTSATDPPSRGEDDVRRREFVGLTGGVLFSAALDEPGDDATDDLAMALVGRFSHTDRPVRLGLLTQAVATAKRDYQACRYGAVVAVLPGLLRDLQAACVTSEGDARLRVHALSAEAHHVTASILFKQEDKGMAWLAADRSVRAAEASQSPLVIGSSSRIVVHALMDGGRHRAATDFVRAAAHRMGTELRTDASADELSIYGSLLLRGAVAAAKGGDRHTAVEFLDEAADAGRRLGHEGNHMWTAFGPGNVLCHRVSVALRLGDAGTAIGYAREVDIRALPINERKGVLFLDTSRALLMCGKHDRALHVLRAAADIAPEEVTGRPGGRRLLHDIGTTAPAGVGREAREYAAAMGVWV
ncbi:XRE family transcriptional regulator [Spongiactinospora sp. 9N601]|uniref:XRE family transcriptional regulator n=1 Tax=Spongiactinospora sp. 9N601 TaxID=3375149 RepID=UPI0037B998EE